MHQFHTLSATATSVVSASWSPCQLTFLRTRGTSKHRGQCAAMSSVLKHLCTVCAVVNVKQKHYDDIWSAYWSINQLPPLFLLICTEWSRKKTTQSLMHHHFAAIRHRIALFAPKCSERSLSATGAPVAVDNAASEQLTTQYGCQLFMLSEVPLYCRDSSVVIRVWNSSEEYWTLNIPQLKLVCFATIQLIH